MQLFESWALNLDDVGFEERVISPNRWIVEGVLARVPNAPIIGFPRSAAGNLAGYATATRVNALGLDYATPLAFVDQHLPKALPVQRDLDSLRLVAGGVQLDERVDAIIAAFSDRSHIFNLGYGIVPETPIKDVGQLIYRVKNG